MPSLKSGSSTQLSLVHRCRCLQDRIEHELDIASEDPPGVGDSQCDERDAFLSTHLEANSTPVA
jgi:hypothetical protein